MKKRLIHHTTLLITALCLTASIAQAQNSDAKADAATLRRFDLLAQARAATRPGFRFTFSERYAAPPSIFTPMAGASLMVQGGGTLGRLAKWTGFTSTNSIIGDSTIFEDKFGKVGIGTDTPTSRLTVAGLIESIGSGGIKFPDGTVQTTAALITVFHDASLTGDGNQAMPLGIAPLGVQTSHLANLAVTDAKIASGQVVKGLNGLTDQVLLAAGANITITPSGNTLTIASPTSDPALTAFQKQVDFIVDDGGIGYSTDIQIPAGKRLVIEYIALTSSGGDDNWVICELTTHLGSDGDVSYEISPVVVDPGNDDFRFTDKQVRIYADGSVHVFFSRVGQDGAMGGHLTISGHLVDLP